MHMFCGRVVRWVYTIDVNVVCDDKQGMRNYTIIWIKIIPGEVCVVFTKHANDTINY